MLRDYIVLDSIARRKMRLGFNGGGGDVMKEVFGLTMWRELQQGYRFTGISRS